MCGNKASCPRRCRCRKKDKGSTGDSPNRDCGLVRAEKRPRGKARFGRGRERLHHVKDARPGRGARVGWGGGCACDCAGYHLRGREASISVGACETDAAGCRFDDNGMPGGEEGSGLKAHRAARGIHEPPITRNATCEIILLRHKIREHAYGLRKQSAMGSLDDSGRE